MHEAPTILLVENDEEKFRCLAAALRAIQPAAPRVAWACSAADAVAYLEGHDGYADRTFFPLPDIIFFDVKSPPATDFRFVRWLRAQPALRALPVLVLSACGDEFDAARASEAGVTAFIHQPCEDDKLVEMLGGIVAQWREQGAMRFSPALGALAAQSCAA